MSHLYKWDTSFTNEDIYVSFGTNGTHNLAQLELAKMRPQP